MQKATVREERIPPGIAHDRRDYPIRRLERGIRAAMPQRPGRVGIQ
jgi:hypothetical protein